MIGLGFAIDSFIRWPFLALAPAGAFYALHSYGRRRAPQVAALAWLAYFFYEGGMKLRILCSGECNIRIDLLALYPLLGLISMVGVVACAPKKS